MAKHRHFTQNPTLPLKACNRLIAAVDRLVVIAVIEQRRSRSIISSDDPISRHPRKDCFGVGHLPLVCGDGAAEPRFAHSRSPCRKGNYSHRLHHVPHRDADCSCNLLQSGMAAGRNSSKQDCIRTLDEPRKHCWRRSTRDFGLRDCLLRYSPLPLIGVTSPLHSKSIALFATRAGAGQVDTGGAGVGRSRIFPERYYPLSEFNTHPFFVIRLPRVLITVFRAAEVKVFIGRRN